METPIPTPKPKRIRRTKAQMIEDRANPKPKPIGRTQNRIKHDVILQNKRRLKRFISKYGSFTEDMKNKFLTAINAIIKPSE